MGKDFGIMMADKVWKENTSPVFLSERLGRVVEGPVFVRLPRIAAASSLASLLAGSVAPDSSIVIDARGSVLQTENFANQLVNDLAANNPVEIIALGGSEDWHVYLRSAVTKYAAHLKVFFLPLSW